VASIGRTARRRCLTAGLAASSISRMRSLTAAFGVTRNDSELCGHPSASTGPDVQRLGSTPIAVSAAGAATSSAPSTSGAPRTPSTAWLRLARVRRE
jgi:hypothetical protein